MIKPLYISRKLINVNDIFNWAKSQNIHNNLNLTDLHVTIAFSRNPVNWDLIKLQTKKIRNKNKNRTLEMFGEATVLTLSSILLEKRWKEIINLGASWDYPKYSPHISLSYTVKLNNLKLITPYYGELLFDKEEMKDL